MFNKSLLCGICRYYMGEFSCMHYDPPNDISLVWERD